jgi:RNA polymerase sigma factor (sigma-70 family)
MDARRGSLEQTAKPQSALADMSDQQLVAEYVALRAPGAFGCIVQRHGPMVMHTSYRLVGNWHDAEDVAQAVFLVLGQRAGSVKCTLAGWLHKVTRDVSLQLLRARARRSRREANAVRSNTTPSPATENELREELDRVLLQLPDRMREAVVLRYLEGHGQEESARLAGCDKGTLSRRCTEGLKRLQSLLSRRSVAVAPAMLPVFLMKQSAGSLPAATLGVLQGIGAGGVVASTQASILAQGALNAMFWAKAKLYAMMFAVTTAVGAGTVAPLLLSSSQTVAPPKPALLRFDFEDGQLPPVCTAGKVVPGPARPDNRFSLEGSPGPGPAGIGKVFLEKDGGLFTYADDLVLVFDLWVDAKVSTVDLHLWNPTLQASQGVEPLRPAREQWVRGVAIPFSSFKAGNVGPRPGDVIGNLSIQVGQAGGTLYVDNLEVVHSAEARPLPKELKK